jgi:hypothetical protein
VGGRVGVDEWMGRPAVRDKAERSGGQGERRRLLIRCLPMRAQTKSANSPRARPNAGQRVQEEVIVDSGEQRRRGQRFSAAPPVSPLRRPLRRLGATHASSAHSLPVTDLAWPRLFLSNLQLSPWTLPSHRLRAQSRPLFHVRILPLYRQIIANHENARCSCLFRSSTAHFHARCVLRYPSPPRRAHCHAAPAPKDVGFGF